jgi:small-conductance mechanosensitive channel
VLVGLTLILAIGEGVPNLFVQPFHIQIGFLALALVVSGILLAWRWEFPGGIISLIGWVLFILAERVSIRHSAFFILLGISSLLFLGSSFLRWHYEKHKSA